MDFQNVEHERVNYNIIGDRTHTQLYSQKTQKTQLYRDFQVGQSRQPLRNKKSKIDLRRWYNLQIKGISKT